MVPENRGSYFENEGLLVKSEKNCGRYHRYKVFGLHVASDILLPELLVDKDTPDMPKVNIRIGKVPSSITGVIEQTEGFQTAKNQFLFRVSGVGCYYVTNGNCIIIEPDEQAEDRIVRLFLLGTAFGALLMQRGILPIHGSAVVFDGRCVIFTGVSGVGKSTLLAAFIQRGYSFLTDDVAAVTVDSSGVPWVHPAYPQQKLWRDSAEKTGVDTTSLTPYLIGINKDKFSVPVHKGFWPLPVPLGAIYELGVEKCKEVAISPLSGKEKMAVLIRHTYRPWLLKGLGLTALHFKQCAAVASQVAISCLTRPDGGFSVEDQIGLLLEDVVRSLTEKAV